MSAELLPKKERAASPSVNSRTEVSTPSALGPRRGFRGLLDKPDVRVGLLTVAVLLVEAALARWVFDVELNFFALLAPFWVFVGYRVSGQRGRTAETVASLGVVVAAAAVLFAYGF